MLENIFLHVLDKLPTRTSYMTICTTRRADTLYNPTQTHVTYKACTLMTVLIQRMVVVKPRTTMLWVQMHLTDEINLHFRRDMFANGLGCLPNNSFVTSTPQAASNIFWPQTRPCYIIRSVQCYIGMPGVTHDSSTGWLSYIRKMKNACAWVGRFHLIHRKMCRVQGPE